MGFSNYNILLKHGGKNIVFNTRTKSLLEVSEEIFDLIRTKDVNALQNLSVRNLNLLKESGNVVNDNINELEYIRVLHNLRKYDTAAAGLGILLTKSCNFACTYCFEQDRKGSMTQESFARLSMLLKNMLPTLHSLNIRWTGGEPLLMWEEIADISDFLRMECEKRSINYIATITTNGYLLNERILEKLVLLGIKQLQITLDGPKEIHDKRRMLAGGGPTFDTILQAINLATSYVNVNLRVNLDDYNINSFQSLIDILDVSILKKDKIKLFCRPVVDCIKGNLAFAGGGFAKVEADLMKIGNRKGFMFSFHPNARFGLRCLYYQCNSYYVDPGLNLFKCPEHLNHPWRAVGVIDETGRIIMTNQTNYLESMRQDPFNLAECRNCRVLPLCYGKCALLYETSGKQKGTGCIPEKRTLEGKIRQALTSQDRLQEFVEDIQT